MDRIDDCSSTIVELCGETLEAVHAIQAEYKKEKNRYLPVPRAIRLIIKEWKELKQDSTQNGTPLETGKK